MLTYDLKPCGSIIFTERASEYEWLNIKVSEPAHFKASFGLTKAVSMHRCLSKYSVVYMGHRLTG